MKRYVKIYMDYYDYCKDDVIVCAMCNNIAVDIHHIKARGMGGSKRKDFIENLIALCRGCHIKAEMYKEFNLKCKKYNEKAHSN